VRNALFRVDKVNHGKTSFDSWNPWKHEPSSVFTPSSRCSTSFYRNMRKYLRKYLHIVSQVFWFLPCSSIFYYTPRVLTTYINLQHLQIHLLVAFPAATRRPLAARIFEVGGKKFDHRSLNRWETMGCFLVIGILMVLKIWVPQVTMSFNAIVLSDFGWVPPILGNPHITRDALRNIPKILRHNMGCNYDTSHSWGYTMDYTRHQT